jgi:hypothetical protein
MENGVNGQNVLMIVGKEYKKEHVLNLNLKEIIV